MLPSVLPSAVMRAEGKNMMKTTSLNELQGVVRLAFKRNLGRSFLVSEF